MPNREQIIDILKTIEDPDLLLDIWFLGLIYEIEIDEQNNVVEITMTFTSPSCPAGPSLVSEIKEKVGALSGVKSVNVKITFDPPWQANDELKGLLGIL
ncbi:MAG TPA: metal-sulfur cluster assembly factor [Oligoflexia bacterium]|nr:metal-sulfur cluster assembly factor [Oligoflexia bacterium]HMP26452.1 metal-sulfur cluster assembly factor [Oligoflexia bacterium]